MITISYLPKLGLGLAFMFTLSCALTFALPSLPDITSIVAGAMSLGVIGLKYRHPIVWCAVAGLLGCLHAAVQIDRFNQWTIPAECEQKGCYVEGKILSVHTGRYRDVAVMRVDLLSGTSTTYPAPFKVTAFFPKHPEPLMPGMLVRVNMTLAAVHGHLNPGTYDAERQAMTQWIQAEGKVIERIGLSPPNAFMRLRASVLSHVQATVSQIPGGWVVPALVFGERAALLRKDKEILLHTGTTHLMAISGLHVGVIAAWVFVLVTGARRLVQPIYQGVPSRWHAPIAAMICIILYSALAGFSVPTIRACMMIGLCLLGELLTRRIPLSHRFIYALSLMVLFDPFVCMQAGFWLSFMAVLFISVAQLDRRSGQGIVSQWWAIQIALFLGLLPLSIYFFNGVSLIGPLANAIAIPWVSVLVLPLAMIGSLLLMASPTLGAIILQLSAMSMDWLMCFLEWIAQIPSTYVMLPSIGLSAVLLGLIGAGLWVLLRPHPLKWVSIALWLPMLLYRPALPVPGAFILHVLDVGQGLSVVVETQQHTLVYDTGPTTDKDGGGAGGHIVTPFLKARGHQSIDTLMLSHLDADHIGGHATLVQHMKPSLIVSSGDYLGAAACEAGQFWSWDGVDFFVLNPSVNQKGSKNNRSCVLRICGADSCAILAGDIERVVEATLIASGQDLRSDVLVVPHHGSKTSSSQAWIEAVRPVFAINASGYHNRYHHPHAQVLERYEQAGVLWHDTSTHGAISYYSSLEASPHIQAMRPMHCRWWHRGSCMNQTGEGAK